MNSKSPQRNQVTVLYCIMPRVTLPPIFCDCIQENRGAWGWNLPRKDYDALSSRAFQQKYFDGGFVMSPEGPYKTYQDLWDEPEP